MNVVMWILDHVVWSLAIVAVASVAALWIECIREWRSK